MLALSVRKLSHYAKYLDIKDDCKIEFKLNNQKIDNDAKLDGIKGFITNDFTLKHRDIIEHYQNLWHIERAFRISKTSPPHTLDLFIID